MTRSLSGSELNQTAPRIAEARILYERGGMSVRKISEQCGLSLAELYAAAKREGWTMRGSPIVSTGKRRRKRGASASRLAAIAQASPDRRRALVGRAWALAEAQMADLERRMRRLKTGAAPSVLGEREARAMASLVRALKELAVLDGLGGTRTPDGADQDDSETASGFPRDVDQLKSELARHLEGLRRERAGKAAARDASE